MKELWRSNAVLLYSFNLSISCPWHYEDITEPIGGCQEKEWERVSVRSGLIIPRPAKSQKPHPHSHRKLGRRTIAVTSSAYRLPHTRLSRLVSASCQSSDWQPRLGRVCICEDPYPYNQPRVSGHPRSIQHAPQGTPYRFHTMTHQYRSAPPIFEHQYERTNDIIHRIWHSLLGLVGPRLRSRSDHGRSAERAPQSSISRGLPLLLIATWILTLWWGERVVFRRSIEQCAWDRWETWVSTTLIGE